MALPREISSSWQTVYGIVVVGVSALFLWSVQSILNPFLLFVLLVVLLSPYRGSRRHLLLITMAALLTLIWLLRATGSLFAPFILAWVLAYVLRPVADALERRRVPRGLAVLLLVVPVLTGIALAIVFGAPALRDQVERFVANAPALVERGQRELARRDIPFLDERGLLAQIQNIRPEQVSTFLESQREEIARRAWSGVLGVGRGLGTVFTILGFFFLTPILAFYLLRDYHQINLRLAGMIPPAQRERAMRFLQGYDQLLAKYLRGQVLAAAIIGTLIGFGLWVAGFPYALALGVVAGVFNVVPYLGLIATLFPALLIALFSGAVVASLIKLALVIGIVQVLEQAVISPRIVGESVGLHPVWLILSLAVGGYFFGFVGLLLAVPVAVLVKLLLTAALGRYRNSSLFLGGNAVRLDHAEPSDAQLTST
ncbi:MAG: AI-2E family transporter [Gemmatimonadetes bacterium]|nr:AI-2E family transporter [Gemmatimonadota bacterium]